MPALDVSVHTLHKDGTETRQFEDAYAFDARHAAVADGASDAFEAGAWARLLVSSFVHAPPEAEAEAVLEWIKAPAKAWNALLRWDAMPWYAQEKARTVGGLATLLGFRLDAGGEADSPTFSALAVGDTCLLHLRGDEVLQRFPLSTADAFGLAPPLLSTRIGHNARVLADGALSRCHGPCQVGDRFLLATDALAEWLYAVASLQNPALGFPDWNAVLDVLDREFTTLVQELRTQRVLRNDDVTLLVATVS